MKNNIKVTEKQLINLVKECVLTVLNESTKISEYEYDGHIISVINYSRDNDEDMEYIRSKKEEIWKILDSGYQKLGGFKGFQTIKDMLKKSPFYRIGYCDGELVTVTVYNGYLGGAKCVGATCVKSDKHDIGVKLLEYIIEYNITDWDNWIWVEASGKIEEMCKNADGFNVPTKFAELYLNHIPFSPVDEYHYTRMISGKKEIKTIFGFKDEESFQIIKNDLNDKVSAFLKKFNLNEEQSVYSRYISKKHPVYKYKSIIDYFVYLKDDEQYNEFTEESIEILKNAIQIVKKFLQDTTIDEKEKYYLRIAIEEGQRVIDSSSIIKPIKVPSLVCKTV